MTTMTAPAARPRLLTRIPFRRYWTAQTVSLLGDEITSLALPLLAVLATQAGPAQMGALTAAGLIPSLLFSLLAGAWADRRQDRRRIMIFADLGRAFLLLLIPFLYLVSALSMTQLYVVAFLVGTLSVLFEVCRTTLFVSLVDRQDYIAANSLLNGSRAMAYMAGPSVGGVLVQVLTAPFTLVADALSYLFSGFMLSRIRPVEPEPSRTKGLGLTEGLRFIWRTRVLRFMLAASTTLNLFNYMLSALFILYAVTYLHLSPAMLGLVIGVASVGALTGAALAGRLSRRFGVGPTLILSYILFPAPLILVPLAGPLAAGDKTTVVAMLFAAEFLSGLGVMLLDIVGGSLQAAVIPDDLRARVSGAHRTINYGIRPVGAMLGGVLGAAIGVHSTLWIATVGGCCAVIWLLLSPIPRVHSLPTPSR